MIRSLDFVRMMIGHHLGYALNVAALQMYRDGWQGNPGLIGSWVHPDYPNMVLGIEVSLKITPFTRDEIDVANNHPGVF